MWKGIWASWLEVRPGIQRDVPTIVEEVHRQSIFLNPFLSNLELIMWGDTEDPRAGIFCRWSQKGISKLKHLWDPGHQVWRDTQDLFRVTRTRNLKAIKQDIIHSVPWSMNRVYPPQIGDWYTLNEPERQLPEEFYYIKGISDRGALSVHVYRRYNFTERLSLVLGTLPVQLPSWQLTRARTILRSPKDGFIEFKPQELPESDFPIYVIKHGRVIDYDLDLKEWNWPNIGYIKAGNFFKYSTKRGYKIINSRQA